MLRSCGVVRHSFRLQHVQLQSQVSPIKASSFRPPSFRKLTIPPSSTSTLPVVNAQPPFAVRTMLVGTSVGLFTPLYVTTGTIVAWHRMLPKNPVVQAATTLLIGGGVGTLLYHYVGPFLTTHSELVLPFAAANGTAAMFWYAALERFYGLEVMNGSLTALAGKRAAGNLTWPLNSNFIQTMFRLGVPFGGPAVGLLTAVSGGYLYPIFCKMLWSEELQKIIGAPSGIGSLDNGQESYPSFSWMVDLHHVLMFPVTIPVGIASGYGLHAMLAPVLLGTVAGGVKPWTAVALPLLTGVSAASVLYFTMCATNDVSVLFWERRFDIETGSRYSFNVRTGAKQPGWGTVLQSEVAAAGVEAFAYLRSFIDRLSNSNKETSSEKEKIELRSNFIGDKPFAYKSLSKHEELFLMLDALVRLKYLDLIVAEQHAVSSGRGSAPTVAVRKAITAKTALELGEAHQESPLLQRANIDGTSGDMSSDDMLGGGSIMVSHISEERSQFLKWVSGIWADYSPNEKLNFVQLLSQCDAILASEEKARQYKADGNMDYFHEQNRNTTLKLEAMGKNHRLLTDHLLILRNRFKDELGYIATEQVLNHLHTVKRSRLGWWDWLTFGLFAAD